MKAFFYSPSWVFIRLFQTTSNDLYLKQVLHSQRKHKYATANSPFPIFQFLYQHFCDVQLTRISTLSTKTTLKPNIGNKAYFGFLNSLPPFISMTYSNSFSSNMIASWTLWAGSLMSRWKDSIYSYFRTNFSIWVPNLSWSLFFGNFNILEKALNSAGRTETKLALSYLVNVGVLIFLFEQNL